jgi:hypothetical protein
MIDRITHASPSIPLQKMETDFLKHLERKKLISKALN